MNPVQKLHNAHVAVTRGLSAEHPEYSLRRGALYASQMLRELNRLCTPDLDMYFLYNALTALEGALVQDDPHAVRAFMEEGEKLLAILHKKYHASENGEEG